MTSSCPCFQPHFKRERGTTTHSLFYQTLELLCLLFLLLELFNFTIYPSSFGVIKCCTLCCPLLGFLSFLILSGQFKRAGNLFYEFGKCGGGLRGDRFDIALEDEEVFGFN